MRAFIAVNLPLEAKDYLFNLKKQVKEAKISWVHKKNLHLTLVFLGEITEDQLNQLKDKLKQIKFKPIKGNLSQIGFFPNNNNPKCMWVSLEPAKEINQLQLLVDQETIGLAHNEQKFVSHITIGRLKGIKNKEKFKKSVEELELEKIEFTINSFQLIKSDLTRTGPKYTVLGEYEAMS